MCERIATPVLVWAYLVEDSSLLLDRIDGEICRTDLLGNTSRFSFLNVGLTDLERC